jgi:hypothetical protein
VGTQNSIAKTAQRQQLLMQLPAITFKPLPCNNDNNDNNGKR